MSELTTIARPYAKAVFDFALENKEIDNWKSMLNFLSELVKNEKISHFLAYSLSANKIADILISISGDQINKHAQNLIKLMAENKRLAIFPDVYQMFNNYVDEYNKIAEVQVISAHQLTATQIKKITVAIEKKLARKVNLNCSLDSSLIAGVIIRTDDFVIDGSSKGQLNRLINELQL